MTTPDPFEFDDAAYVLDALEPDERAAFEAHLATCAACRDRVRELRPVPDLLRGINAAEAFAPADPPVPELLLPALLRQVRTRRKRQRLLVGALGAIAAACIAALIAVVVPSSSGPTSPTGVSRTFAAVQPVPIKATARLTATSWGTRIEVRCHYSGQVDRGYQYGLVAVGANGQTEQLGNWNLPPDKDVWYRTGTSLTPAQIHQLEITLPDGTPVLQLNL